MKSLFRHLVGILFGAGILLSLTSCAPPFFSEEEVLEILSERYGEEFVIIETLNNKCSSATSSGVVKRKLYSAALSNNPTNIFWVQQSITKYGGLFATYGRGVEDTLLFDYFLESFYGFLQTNKIDSFFVVGYEEKELVHFLAEPHLQGGMIYIYITEETATEIVTTIFDFLDDFYEKYPSKDEFHEMHLGIGFYDKSKITRQELYESAMFIPSYGLYDYYGKDATDIASLLENINSYYYGNLNS